MNRNNRSSTVSMPQIMMTASYSDNFESGFCQRDGPCRKGPKKMSQQRRSLAGHRQSLAVWLSSLPSTSRQSSIASLNARNGSSRDLAWVWHPLKAGNRGDTAPFPVSFYNDIESLCHIESPELKCSGSIYLPIGEISFLFVLFPDNLIMLISSTQNSN